MKHLKIDITFMLNNKMFRSKLFKKLKNDKESTKGKFWNRLPQ